ncbi:hypothetical protein LINPERPRIM_LOCUS33072 [Linum perenne]
MHETDNILLANEISREYEGLSHFPSADIVVADKSFEASNHVVSKESVLRNQNQVQRVNLQDLALTTMLLII